MHDDSVLLLAFIVFLEYNNNAPNVPTNVQFDSGQVPYIHSEEGTVLNSPQDISREIAIYSVLAGGNEIRGDNFVGARSKMLGMMLRPADIHLVELKARELYRNGTIVMRGRDLVMDADKVGVRLGELVHSIDKRLKVTAGMNDSLKAEIRALAEQLQSQDLQLTSA